MSGASGTVVAERDTASSRRGSRFSDKQIAHAVKDRTAVEVTLHSGDTFTGWVYGMDDFHIGIADMYGDTMLVHKSAAAVIRFTNQVSAEDGAVRNVCEPFRKRVMREHFSETSPQ